jgi:hypothetical protein
VNLLRGALLALLRHAGAHGQSCFSNRPFGVKRFQTIHLYGIGTKALPSWDFEDEVEQSIGRPYRQTNSRSKRTYDLTSSIVP